MSSGVVSGLGVSRAFMPHGMCYLWQPGVLTVHIASDLIIAIACCSIPVGLLYVYRERREQRFQWIYPCFAAFIIACGLTHLLDIWTLWSPDYWLSSGVTAATAVASAGTAVLFVRWVPRALQLPSAEALQSANRALEAEVAERTAELNRVNDILLRENARFAIAADAAGLGFWSRDIAANTLQWDGRMFRMCGQLQMEGELAPECWLECIHPDDRAAFARDLDEALKSAGEYDSEFRVVRPNGAVRNLRAVAHIMRDESGAALRMFGVSFDITDLKRADEQFRLAIEAAPTGMLLMDVTGGIAMVNAQIEKLFGYPRAELLGRPIEMLVPAASRSAHQQMRAEFFAAPRARPMGTGRDVYGLRKDGLEVPIAIELTPVHTSDGDFVLSSIVDQSLRREMERMTKDFVSTVSHELRTPLTSINGSLGLLQTGALGMLPERAASMVQIAYKNSGRLVRIINDILDIGKLDAGELTIRRGSVALGELLRQSIEVNSGYAEKYNVRFLLDDACADEWVVADPDRLMQVIANLLSNAAKFSSPGTAVHIRARRCASTMRVEVEDTGSGIPETFRDRIFQKFAQADPSATRRVDGTGLGLSIARKLIEAMNGTIGFDSVVGQGTVFYFELPIAESAESAESA